MRCILTLCLRCRPSGLVTKQGFSKKSTINSPKKNYAEITKTVETLFR